MLIEYTGLRTRRRLVGSHEWSKQTGFRQEVPADLAAALLTDPGGEFWVHPEEPLLSLVNEEMAGRLALAGIGSGYELAAVRQAKRLATEVGVTARQVSGWIRAAASLPEAGEAEPEPERHG